MEHDFYIPNSKQQLIDELRILYPMDSVSRFRGMNRKQLVAIYINARERLENKIRAESIFVK